MIMKIYHLWTICPFTVVIFFMLNLSQKSILCFVNHYLKSEHLETLEFMIETERDTVR